MHSYCVYFFGVLLFNYKCSFFFILGDIVVHYLCRLREGIRRETGEEIRHKKWLFVKIVAEIRYVGRIFHHI